MYNFLIITVPDDDMTLWVTGTSVAVHNIKARPMIQEWQLLLRNSKFYMILIMFHVNLLQNFLRNGNIVAVILIQLLKSGGILLLKSNKDWITNVIQLPQWINRRNIKTIILNISWSLHNVWCPTLILSNEKKKKVKTHYTFFHNVSEPCLDIQGDFLNSLK